LNRSGGGVDLADVFNDFVNIFNKTTTHNDGVLHHFFHRVCGNKAIKLSPKLSHFLKKGV
jgi:hypothetical protein